MKFFKILNFFSKRKMTKEEGGFAVEPVLVESVVFEDARSSSQDNTSKNGSVLNNAMLNSTARLKISALGQYRLGENSEEENFGSEDLQKKKRDRNRISFVDFVHYMFSETNEAFDPKKQYNFQVSGFFMILEIFARLIIWVDFLIVDCFILGPGKAVYRLYHQFLA